MQNIHHTTPTPQVRELDRLIGAHYAAGRQFLTTHTPSGYPVADTECRYPVGYTHHNQRPIPCNNCRGCTQRNQIDRDRTHAEDDLIAFRNAVTDPQAARLVIRYLADHGLDY